MLGREGFCKNWEYSSFFCQVFFHGHWQLIGQRGKEGNIFDSTLPLLLTNEHSDIYFQLCTWVHYHILLIALLVFTRLLLEEIYHLVNYRFIDWWCEVRFCLFNWWFETRFLLHQSWNRKWVDSNLHGLSPLYYKRTD